MKKFLALTLMLLMLLSAVMLTSCDTQTDNPSTPDGSSSTESADTTPAPATDLELVVDGVAKVGVVRSADIESSSLTVTAASGLLRHIINTIEPESGNEPKIYDDFKKPGEEYDPDKIEILVGKTAYSETQEVMSELGYGEYIVKVVGKKIVVTGYTDTAVNMAANKLKSLITSLAVGKNLTIPADTLITGVVDQDINALPHYEDGTFSATYLSGNGATEIIFTDTTPEAYTAYLAKLEQAGYTTYTTNTITDNRFATLNNDKYTVNASYYAYEKSTRVIIEDLATPVGLESDNVYTAVTTSQITMLGLEYYNSSEDKYMGNGLSMLIRLTDGRFIIIDGGFTGRADKDASMLVNLLKEQSADYIGDGKITIAAWIITHAHGDHMGMISKASAYFRKMNVERFIVNFMSETERTKAAANWDSAGEGSGWSNVITAAKVLKADVQYVRPGQVLYLADAKLEVLYTIDSYGPKVCNALNTTSLIIKFTFGDSTTFLMTGDATGPAFQICSKMYGSYLKCDILQVAHHGYTTWGTESGTISAYKHVSPSLLLWPQGSRAYPNYKGKSYNVVLFSPSEGGSNANFKECYVAGGEGDTIVVPIPYVVGNVNVTRN